MSRIETAYGRRLPLATLFENPSVDRLAHVLRERSGGFRAATLIELRGWRGRDHPAGFRPSGRRRRRFCYGALARHLDPGRAFLAFRAPGLDGDGEPPAGVESMAALYVDQLQARQPHGPYLLGGWSVGGMVAWEMARQLEQRGERVALLALLDTWALPRGGVQEDELQLLAEFAFHLGLPVSDLAVATGELAGLDAGGRLDSLLAKAKLAGVVPADLSPSRVRDLFGVFSAIARANDRYVPVPGSTPVRLWRAAESAATAPDPTLGWSLPGARRARGPRRPWRPLLDRARAPDSSRGAPARRVPVRD